MQTVSAGGENWRTCLYPVLQSIPIPSNTINSSRHLQGWSGGVMVLGKLPVPGRPTVLITVGQGPTALAVGAGGGCLDGWMDGWMFELFIDAQPQ